MDGTKTIEDICLQIVDCEHKTAPIDPSGQYFAVGTPAMRGNTINYEESRRISAETFALWTRRLLPQQGDLLFAREAPVGPLVRVPETGNVAPGQRTMLLRPDPAQVDSDFLFYLLTSSEQQERLISMAAGSTVAHLNVADVRAFRLPALPSMAEQRAIAEVLGALDDKIAANTKLAETIEQLGRAKLTRLGINEEPEGESVFLDAYFDFNPRRSAVCDETVLIDMQALPTSQPLVSRWSKGPKRGGARFMNGDTLLARITPCLENRKTGFVDFLSDGEVGIGSTEFIVVRSRAGIPLGTSYFVATSDRFRDFAIQNMVGTSGRQRVSASDIARFELNPIAATDLVEFGEWADANLKVLGALRDENRTLAATRDALLPQLMSGKLRVKDIENTMGEMV